MYKPSTLLRSLIFFFWVSCYLGSTDFFGEYELMYAPFLNEFFTYRFPFGRGLLLFEWAVVLLSIYVLSKNLVQFNLVSPVSKILIGIIFVNILILLNPNNTSNILELFLSHDSKFVWILPLFLLSFIFLREGIKKHIYKEFITIGFWITLLHSGIAFIFYILLSSPVYLGYRVTTPHSDNLLFMGFFEILMVLKFVFSREKKYLLGALFLITVMILSLRRTEFLMVLVINIGVISFLILKFAKIYYFKLSIISILTVGSVIGLAQGFGVINLDFLISRQISVLSYFSPDLQHDELPDSGHLKQAITTTETLTMFDYFWGGGIQQQSRYIFGQSSRAHNNLAYGAAKYGIFVSLFYIFLFVLFLKNLLGTMFKTKSIIGDPHTIYQFTFYLMLTFFFIAGWASGMGIFDSYPQNYIYFIILLGIVNLSWKDVKGYII